jgi:hypothetical protein
MYGIPVPWFLSVEITGSFFLHFYIIKTSVVDPNPKYSECFGWIRIQIQKKIRMRIRIQTLL